MGISRREFLKRSAAIAGAAVISSKDVSASENFPDIKERYGVLVDTTLCTGCRRCEWACNEWNKNPNRPLKDFEDKSVFREIRRTDAKTFTVVNSYDTLKDSKPVYVKKQCMHCEDPACLSACFVNAFKKNAKGAVLYNPELCMGCRYCMIACPFSIPAYEYDDPITPKVRKCTFCFDRKSGEGDMPACVEICTTEALRFGKRSNLINLALERINKNPHKYFNHIYGEHEVGGTSWLYLSSVPFDKIGFRTDLGNKPIPDLSRSFLFMAKMFEVAAAWPLVFAAFYALSKIRNKGDNKQTKDNNDGESYEQKT